MTKMPTGYSVFFLCFLFMFCATCFDFISLEISIKNMPLVILKVPRGSLLNQRHG